MHTETATTMICTVHTTRTHAGMPAARAAPIGARSSSCPGSQYRDREMRDTRKRARGNFDHSLE